MRRSLRFVIYWRGLVIIEETTRLICKSEMNIIEGYPKPPVTKLKEINLLNIKPRTGREFGFVFYDKNTDERICQIHFENKRRDYEISYGTEEQYWGKGYMQEALSFFVKWMFANTSVDCLYALMNIPGSAEPSVRRQRATLPG